MLINKEGKLFGKISIIDILVVLAILVGALGIYSRFFVSNQKVETSSSHIEYTMKIKEVRIGTVDALKNYGGVITDSTTKESLGEIVDVSYEDAVKSVETANGQLKTSPVPERYDVTLTVRVDGKINSSGFYTSTNQALAAGSSKAAKTSGTILDIYEVK